MPRLLREVAERAKQVGSEADAKSAPCHARQQADTATSRTQPRQRTRTEHALHEPHATTVYSPLYSTLRNRPSLAALVREFAADLPGMVAPIRVQLEAGALEDVRKQAHRLKGSTGGYGFPEIMRAAAALEISAATGDIRMATVLLDLLTVLCDRAAAGAHDTMEGS